MNFKTAIEECINGKKVRSTCWLDDIYVIFHPEILKFEVKNGVQSLDTLPGTEWEYYEEDTDEEIDFICETLKKALVNLRNECSRSAKS